MLLLPQVVPGTDLFNQMPSEVVLLVFKWLPKCTLAKSARGESPQIIKNLLLGIRNLFSEEADEILYLLHIIQSYINSFFCAVCKRWLRLSQDESLWRRLDLGLATVPAGVVGQVSTVWHSTINSTVQYSTV